MTPEQYLNQIEQSCLSRYHSSKAPLQQGMRKCEICGSTLHFRWAYAWGTEWVKCSNPDCIDFQKSDDFSTKNLAIIDDAIRKNIDSENLGRLVSKPARKKLLVKSQPKSEASEEPKRKTLVKRTEGRKILIKRR